MENKGLVSVIIPVYNVEEYLQECVESVLKQTYKIYEIILVDDGSTDLSGKICDDYAEKYECIKVLHKENGGLSIARNTGMQESVGEYIYFLDSDDFIACDTFEILVSEADKNSSDFVFFDACSFVDGDDNESISQNYKREKQYDVAEGLEMLSVLTENKDFHSAIPLMFFKKAFLSANSLFFEENIVYEDVLFALQAFCLAKSVSHCNKNLYFRRYRGSSIMTSEKDIKYFKSIVTVYEKLNEFAISANIVELDVIKKHICRCAFNIFNVYEKLNEKDKRICSNQYKEVKNNILKGNAYGNTALKMRCYGKVFWFGYKVLEKTVGRFFI